MGTRQGKSQAQPTNHNRIARAIFAAAESMGIADREMLEELAGQAIQRLEPTPFFFFFLKSKLLLRKCWLRRPK